MISNLRVRLTVFYGGIFVVFVAILLAVSYWLMVRHLGRTVDPFEAANALSQLRLQYGLALAGATLVATALGWWFAGRELTLDGGRVRRARALRGQRVARAALAADRDPHRGRRDA